MTRTLRQWKARMVGGLIALSGLGMVGCKHQLFTEPADSDLLRRPNIPAGLETRPHDPILPPAANVQNDPATVLDLKRQLRPISLKEAIAIAVEQGNIGAGQTGSDSLALGANVGAGVTSDTVKAFVMDPAVQQAEVERVASRFDARWITSMSWNKQDQAQVSFQQSLSNGDAAAFSSTLAKPLPTGGVAGITFSMNYQNLSTPPTSSLFAILATSYTSRVQFVFEQPLLQGFGVEANQLLSSHPGSIGLIQGLRVGGANNGGGILVARVRNQQARTAFDAQMNQLLVNVEVAYWNLYAEYYNLHAQQEGLRQAFDAYKFIRPRVKEGLETDPSQLPQLEAQYHQFYLQVIDARGRVLEAERKLRGLLGLRSDDGTIFHPTDEPVRALVAVNYQAAYHEGLQTRPEVLFARQELKAQQLVLQGRKYERMPDVRLFSSYDLNGVGSRFYGADNNTFSNLASNQFNNWQVGLRADIPFGFREANSLVRREQLNLWRVWVQLEDSERKVFELLVQAKRQLDQAYANIITNQRIKDATQQQVEIIAQRVKVGQFTGASAYLVLTQAQQSLARAVSAEFRAVADYNSALAQIEYAKGTIQRYNNVSVADGPLPAFVQTKAADHFRARSAAIQLREHPADTAGAFSGSPLPGLDQMPAPADLPGVIVPPANALPPALPAPMPAPVTDPAKKGAELGAASPMSKPAPSTVKPWDTWQSAPGNTATSTPATLPQLNNNPRVPSADTSAATGSFVPNGTLTLPKRSAPATADAAPPPAGTPIGTGTQPK